MEEEMEVLARSITRDYPFPAQIGVVIYLEWIPEHGRHEIERIGAPDEFIFLQLFFMVLSKG